MSEAKQYKTEPMAHQLEALARSSGKNGYGYLGEQGTGKTWIAINDAARLWASGEIVALLVVAPNGVHLNWTERELPKHMPDWVRWRAEAWTSSTTKKNVSRIDSILGGKDFSELRVLTMNWEALQSKRGSDFALKFARMASGKLMIVADESHNMQNPSANRTESMFRIKPHSKIRRIMTGTLTDGNPFGAFSQFTFLEEYVFGTTSFYAFKAEYAEMLPSNNKLVEDIAKRTGKRGVQIVAKDKSGRPRYKNIDKLQRIISAHSYRILKQECMDLPAKMYTQDLFDLSPEQRKAYEKMDEEFRVLMNDGDTIAVARLSALMKLSQISSGFVHVPGSQGLIEHIKGENPKLDVLRARIESCIANGQSAIVFARFREELRDIEGLLNKIGVDHGMLHGDISKADRESYIDQFEAKKIPIIVAQTKVGGVGYTMVAASVVIYYSNTFALRDRLQSEDRAHRIGQTKSVLYVDIMARDTRDEMIVSTLRNKGEIASLITGDLQRLEELAARNIAKDRELC